MSTIPEDREGDYSKEEGDYRFIGLHNSDGFGGIVDFSSVQYGTYSFPRDRDQEQKIVPILVRFEKFHLWRLSIAI